LEVRIERLLVQALNCLECGVNLRLVNCRSRIGPAGLDRDDAAHGILVSAGKEVGELSHGQFFGVLQPRRHLGLGAEPRPLLGRGEGSSQHPLRSHDAIEGEVAGLADDAHAAAAHLLEDLVARHACNLAGRQFPGGRTVRGDCHGVWR
jgi:hypothetical protein